MMKYVLGISAVLLAIVLYVSLGSRKSDSPDDVHQVTVMEVYQAGNYTYLYVKEKRSKKWLAVPSMIASPGDVYYYQGGMLMENFESRELDRVFESVLFLERVFDSEPSVAGEMDPATHTGAIKDPRMNFEIEPARDGITIAELYNDRDKYSGEIVRIRGAVTKFNPAIMNKNWIHIQDGTESGGNWDLTVTTDQSAEPGTTITVEGRITLDRDFGYGYVYEILMEDAKILSEL
jgi:hypothetical protein